MTELVTLEGGSITRRLELTCRLVDEMLEDNPEFLDELAVPVALFGSSPVPELTNAPWRVMFGTQALPGRLVASITTTRTSGSDTFDSKLAVLLHRRRRDDIVIVCGAVADPSVREISYASLSLERAARADAEHANAMKDRFLAAVSHELRTPITTMLLWEKILRDPSSSAALQATAIDAIRQSAETQSRLVGDLLDVSRATSGKLHIDVSVVELDPILAAAVAAIAPFALAKQIVIEHDSNVLVGAVLGDQTRIRQILDNLLTNAVKFTNSPGHVIVVAKRDPDHVTIDVADSGRGITKEFLPKVFEPFSQGDELARQAGGLGLGLAISHELATLHNGTLTARSQGVNRGATFSLRLPSTQLEPRLLKQVRVLVIDDDRRVLDALALLLDRAGAIVITADSAATARARIALDPPQALICDLGMPHEDGYSLLRDLRAAGSTIPAIALTAHASVADIQRARAAGFEVHLAKPVDIIKLVENIDQLVRAIA